MFADPITQWVFTIVFLLLVVHSLVRLMGERAVPVLIIGHLLHVVMSLDMAVMAWPWWTQVPWSSQVAFFAAATLWYLVLGGMTARSRHRAQRWGGGPAHQLMHALMMGAMTWMVLAMAPGEAGSGGAHAHHLMSAGVAVAGILLTAGLLAAGAASATRAGETFHLQRRLPGVKVRRGWPQLAESGASTVMNLGMAAMCALMLAM